MSVISWFQVILSTITASLAIISANIILIIVKERRTKKRIIMNLLDEIKENRTLLHRSTWQPLIHLAWDDAKNDGFLRDFPQKMRDVLISLYTLIFHRNHLLSLRMIILPTGGQLVVADAQRENERSIDDIMVEQRVELEELLNCAESIIMSNINKTSKNMGRVMCDDEKKDGYGSFLHGNYLDIIFLTIGLIFIVSSSVISLYYIPNIDNQIAENELYLSDINIMIQKYYDDFREYQEWDTKALILRNVINILSSVNNTEYVDSVKDREKELLETQIAGLGAISRHLDITNQTWGCMNHDEIQIEKQKLNTMFNEAYNTMYNFKNNTESKIIDINKRRENLYYWVPILSIFGTIISQIGVIIHWKY